MERGVGHPTKQEDGKEQGEEGRLGVTTRSQGNTGHRFMLPVNVQNRL